MNNKSVQILKHLKRILGSVMICVYLLAGGYLVFHGSEIISPTQNVVLGAMLIVYAVFRIYRLIREIREDSEEEEEGNEE